MDFRISRTERVVKVSSESRDLLYMIRDAVRTAVDPTDTTTPERLYDNDEEEFGSVYGIEIHLFSEKDVFAAEEILNAIKTAQMHA